MEGLDDDEPEDGDLRSIDRSNELNRFNHLRGRDPRLNGGRGIATIHHFLLSTSQKSRGCDKGGRAVASKLKIRESNSVDTYCVSWPNRQFTHKICPIKLLNYIDLTLPNPSS